jgi:hypothetical protein
VSLSYRKAVCQGQLWRAATSVVAHLDVSWRTAACRSAVARTHTPGKKKLGKKVILHESSVRLSQPAVNFAMIRNPCYSPLHNVQPVHLVAVLVALVVARPVEQREGPFFYAAASLVLLILTPLASLALRHRLTASLSQNHPELAVR